MPTVSALSKLLDYFEENQNKTIAEVSNDLNLKYGTIHQTIKRHNSRFNKRVLDSGAIVYSLVDIDRSPIPHHYIHRAFFAKELGLTV